MGHRALIGKTLPSGEIEIYYSHWGALNAYEAGEKIEVPECMPDEVVFKVSDRFAFGKEIDYLHHEAVWLDGVCYCPIWVFPSDSIPVGEWKTQGQGILLKADTGNEFREHKCMADSKYNVDDILDVFDVPIKIRIRLMENIIVGHSTIGQIPDFSPMGNVVYNSTRELLKELIKGETK